MSDNDDIEVDSDVSRTPCPMWCYYWGGWRGGVAPVASASREPVVGLLELPSGGGGVDDGFKKGTFRVFFNLSDLI